jgi:hypothetical protein
MQSVHDQTPAVIIKRRKRYDTRYKAKVVYRYYELIEENGGVILRGTQTAISKEFGISADKNSKWLSNRDLLIEESKSQNGKKKCVYTVEKVKFREEEELLFETFYLRRQLFGLWVDRYWLCDEFYDILELSKPPGWELFKYSKGWVWNFCKRWGITEQCRTNKKDIPINSR